MSEPLLILGASARAAAQAAVRAGFALCAVDLFADEDLRSLCPTRKIDNYPGGFLAAAREFPASPWIYTGGLENHPALIDRLAAERPLLGNPGPVLRAVRNPLRLAAALREAGLKSPETSRTPLHGKQCLRKPRQSSGGANIELWWEQAVATSKKFYYQELIPGPSASAIYVVFDSRAVLLGVTRQLVGEAWTGANGFRYCGSIGPLPLADSRRAEYDQLGACLAKQFALCGLFGVDVVENDAGIWPVEVNPRYTASVEVLERSLGLDSIGLHVASCRNETLPAVGTPANNACWGKAVIFARQDSTIGPGFIEYIAQLNADRDWPLVADLPQTGTHVRAGHPVVSIFANGRELAEAEQALRRLAVQIESVLSSTSSSR